MSRRLELDPEKAALLNKKVEQIRETIRYALKKDGRPATAMNSPFWENSTTPKTFQKKGEEGISQFQTA